MVSLRARVFLGALLWSLGLFLGSGMILTHYMLFVPQAPGIFHGFFIHYMYAIFIVTIASMVIGLRQVRKGLASFDELRARLPGVREGKQSRLDGEYPSEVQPLVNDLNALLADREQRITKAQLKAGDLAHGLKTPLTLLNQQAERAREGGQRELAAAITQQIERMRRQIEYHLAHARASAAGGTPAARCHVLTSADALARTMLALHAERSLSLDCNVSHEHFVRAQREDFEEMLGNLVDNACKWARSRVTVQSTLEGGSITTTVDDDGPGLADALRETVLQRGVRADEAAPGSGLGLAIVADLVELYGGTITLTSSPLGGLRAILRLPSAS
ncbi:MAG TPA: ATP-binding protein [Vicinamibacterales bacterium]|nr:ATP-binding protein [Vicinamibacterales bacterium]